MNNDTLYFSQVGGNFILVFSMLHLYTRSLNSLPLNLNYSLCRLQLDICALRSFSLDNDVLLLCLPRIHRYTRYLDFYICFDSLLFVIQSKLVKGETFLKIGDKTLMIVVEVTQISINLLFSPFLLLCKQFGKSPMLTMSGWDKTNQFIEQKCIKM